MRTQVTLRLSRAEMARLDEAAARLHIERAALIRAAALGAADVVLETARPLVLAVGAGTLLRRLADHLEPPRPAARSAERPKSKGRKP